MSPPRGPGHDEEVNPAKGGIMGSRSAGLALLLTLSHALSACTEMVAGILTDVTGVPIVEKVVASRLEPNILVATDGTRCITTPARWQETFPGDEYFCAWSGF
jgi:hypothetical protein